jgi:hypothetical protein
MPHAPKQVQVEEKIGVQKDFTWSPKAKKFMSGEGYVVKTKARLNHECHICGEVIAVNEEYYKLQYYGNWTRYPICESCWNGSKMDAKNKSTYQSTEEFATEGRRDY